MGNILITSIFAIKYKLFKGNFAFVKNIYNNSKCIQKKYQIFRRKLVLVVEYK